MAFEIRLVLPEPSPQDKVPPVVEHKTTGFLDDDPERPLYLTDACEVFEAKGVRFEIDGFFDPPLPVTTEPDLAWFLESLPGLLRFLGEKANTDYKILLWEQGLETDFKLHKSADGELVTVEPSNHLSRKMVAKTETLRRSELVSQMLQFVSEYREAAERYYPIANMQPWNQDLFDYVRHLKK